MADFTPGPWHADPQPTQWPDKLVTDLMVRNEDGEPVAWVGMAATHQDITGFRNIEGNARLIAAAPELARLLFVVHEAIRRGEWDSDLWDWLYFLLDGPVAATLQQIGALTPQQTIWQDNAPIDQIADAILAEADALCERPPLGDGPAAGGQQP